jgi:hypothetical protein
MMFKWKRMVGEMMLGWRAAFSRFTRYIHFRDTEYTHIMLHISYNASHMVSIHDQLGPRMA